MALKVKKPRRAGSLRAPAATNQEGPAFAFPARHQVIFRCAVSPTHQGYFLENKSEVVTHLGHHQAR
jgi:hypothetical protein